MTLIPCPCCEGDGTIPLSEHLEATLALVARKGTTASHVAHKLDISASLANHRLIDLCALKLVTRKRNGICWRYSRK